MKSIKHFILAPLLCCSALTSSKNLFAESDMRGFFAFGAVYVPEYEGSDDYYISPFGAGRLEFGDYYIETKELGLRADISTWENFDFGPAINYRNRREDDVDNIAVALLDELDGAVEVGFFARFKNNGYWHPSDELAFEVSVLTDASDTHDGTLVSFGPSYAYSPSSKLRLSTSLVATYVNDDYATTYFGINAENIGNSTLSFYDAEGGLRDVGISVTANYFLDEQWGLLGFVGYNEFLGDAADSPVIIEGGNASQFIFGTGVTYFF
ncbi:MAG: MipA/OmpV family protein [Pseudomonadota bacterium]